jgi:hypothetical protein
MWRAGNSSYGKSQNNYDRKSHITAEGKEDSSL